MHGSESHCQSQTQVLAVLGLATRTCATVSGPDGQTAAIPRGSRLSPVEGRTFIPPPLHSLPRSDPYDTMAPTGVASMPQCPH